MTREQRKRRRAQVLRVVVCIAILVMLIVMFSDAFAAETPVSGREYLSSADAEHREHILGVIEENA